MHLACLINVNFWVALAKWHSGLLNFYRHTYIIILSNKFLADKYSIVNTPVDEQTYNNYIVLF